MTTDQLQIFLLRHHMMYEIVSASTMEIETSDYMRHRVATGEPTIKLSLNLQNLENLMLIDQRHDEMMRETRLRLENPAAQKAWENYRMIMSLIK
jgi:hypothetical protein